MPSAHTLAAFDSPRPDRNDQAEAGGGETPVLDTNVDSSCVRPLSDLGWSCPATFTDVLANNITCITYEEIDIGECATDPLLVLRRNFGTHAVDCLYDPQSQALVGASSPTMFPPAVTERWRREVIVGFSPQRDGHPAIQTDCFKLLILAISCKDLGAMNV